MKEEYKNIKLLLEKVKQITAKHEEIAHLKGENFNVFNILDKRTDEVRTHSAMIAELLNPKGSHGMGDTFLGLFIDVLNDQLNSKGNTSENRVQIISKNNLEGTQVYAEYNIGEVKDTSGGQIDILLSNDDFIICIENKINAGDQDYQLIRYHNYLKKQNKKHSILFYLTLEGNNASDKSIQYSNNEGQQIELSPEEDYHCLSYRKDILQWLEKCYHYSIDLPVLRESIKQYINLIKSLTHQLISNKMKEEVKKAIFSDIESAENIKNTFDEAVKTEALKLRDAVYSKLKSEYPKARLEKAEVRSNISIFIEAINGRVGIESFNGNGNFNDKSLFVGLLGYNKIKEKWEWEKSEIIFPQKEIYQSLQQYSKGDFSDVNKIVEKAKEFINTHNIELIQ